MSPNVMKGVVLTGHGGPEMLVWREDLPVPHPGPGEVLVRVRAAGMNNTDINTRLGWYAPEVTSATGEDVEVSEAASGGWGGALQFPRIQGGDFCGEVVALGDGVDTGWLNNRVTAPLCLPRATAENPVGMKCIGSEMDGAFAQFLTIEAGDLHNVTAAPLSNVEIAAIPCAFGTAENMLTRANVAEGQAVLVTGASGGVGLAAVQLARLRGARVTAVTSPAKAGAVQDAGAETILGRGDTPTENEFHAVIDVVGGDGFPALIRAVKPGGHIVVSGAIAGPIVETDLRALYLPDRTLHGATYQPPAVFERLVRLMNAGQIHPLVSKTYDLRDIHAAQDDFQSKRYPGKLVLVPPEDDI